ncbi:MAG: peptidylprolyl isomerase [Pseudomonadota bacterium]|nr:peptidylprolyl isomerase [Pseudomonadota bacterium]
MQQRFNVPAFARTAGGTALAIVTLAALTACGGGDSGTPPTSTVTSSSVAATRYGSPAVVTMSGTNLDSSGLSVTSSGCKSMARLTSGSLVSSATAAYYTCTVSGAFSSTVQIQSNGVTIANPAFSVPAPQVKFTVTNGLGVSGDIVLTLMGDKVPATVDNFLAYVNAGFYKGTIFHRIAKLIADPSKTFVIQGGGYGATVNGQLPAHKTTNAPIAVETAGGNNVQWSVAMANAGAGTTVTSEFFFNAMDNTSALANGYSVFGNITTGIDVAQAIIAAPATCVNNALTSGTLDCLPQPDVTITSATQSQ